jgi:MFS family permease
MKKYLVKVSLDHFAFGLTIPIGVVWQLSRGINIEQVAVVVSIMTVVTLVTDIPTGVLADKYGRKPSLVLGSAILGLSVSVLAVSHSFLMFCIYGVLSGLGWALLSGAEEAYIFETSQEEKKIYKNSLSDVTIADEIATIGGLVIAAVITKYFGLQQTIFSAAMLLGVAAIVSAVILSEPKKHLSEIGRTEKKLTAGALRFLKEHSPYLAIMLIFAIYYEGGRVLWQPQLINNGVKLYQLGALFAFFKLFSIAGSIFAKKSTFQKFRWPMIALGLILGLTFLMISSNILALIIIGFCVYSFAENYTRVLQSDYLNKAVVSHRASFLSLNNIARNGYSAVITPFLGAIALTHIAKGFMFLMIVQVIAVIALGALINRKQRVS